MHNNTYTQQMPNKATITQKFIELLRLIDVSISIEGD